MDRTMDEEGKNHSFGRIVAGWILMVLVYNAALNLLWLPFLAADKAGILPLGSSMNAWSGNLIATASMLLVAGVVMRLMRGTREECGLVFDRGDAYIRYAVGIGAVVAVVRYAGSALSYLGSGSVFSYFHSFGQEQAFPIMMGYTALSLVFGAAEAFLLFGVMQAYLSRTTSAHLRLGPWEVPVSGIMVLAVILIPEFITLARQMVAGYPFLAAATLVKVLCTCMVTLASSYWFERSRSITSPAIALGMAVGLGPLIRHAMYVWFR